MAERRRSPTAGVCRAEAELEADGGGSLKLPLKSAADRWPAPGGGAFVASVSPLARRSTPLTRAAKAVTRGDRILNGKAVARDHVEAVCVLEGGEVLGDGAARLARIGLH
jgi:hypothetical protein